MTVRYSVYTLGLVKVSLDVDNPNRAVAIAYEGDSTSVAVLQRLLESSYGAFGHLIGTSTTPIDLDCALKQLLQAEKIFLLELIEGEDLVQSYDPSIPDEAVT